MIFLAWSSTEAADGYGEGPWVSTFDLGHGLVLVDSEQTRSVVYHAVKHSLPPGTAVLVAPLDDAPKSKGLAPGAAAWLRTHR